jgi:nucleotide-binding universal stress UspA family protein
MESRHKGAIEAEAHRISEEVTREAQERARSQALARTTPLMPAPPPINAQRVLPVRMPLQRILVPLDGTPEAERALPHAAALARIAHAAVTLVHVSPPDLPHPAALLDHIAAGIVPPDDALPSDISAYLAALWARLRETVPGVAFQVLSAASPTRALLGYEQRAHVDLVVLATRRHARGDGYPIGHLAESLLRHGGAPLLLIPPEAIVPSAGHPPFARVLVPLDGSALAEAALAPLLTLLTAESDTTPTRVLLLTSEEQLVIRPDSEDYLDDTRRLLIGAVPHAAGVVTTLIQSGPPAESIVRATHAFTNDDDAPAPCDLLIMATHGRGGLGRWFFGSVAESVLVACIVPILLIYPTTFVQ